MSTTITIRTGTELRTRLESRAREAGLTLSAYLRSILEREVAEVPLGDRVGHLRGRLRVGRPDREEWREAIRERNRRP